MLPGKSTSPSLPSAASKPTLLHARRAALNPNLNSAVWPKFLPSALQNEFGHWNHRENVFYTHWGHSILLERGGRGQNLVRLCVEAAAMIVANSNTLRTDLPGLLKEVAAGGGVVISQEGRPVAKLVPYRGGQEPRRPGGSWKGKIRMAEDFDVLPDSVLKNFEGGAERNGAAL